MSKRQVVLVASRAFALLMIVWGMVELTYLPERAFELFHHIGQRSVLQVHDFVTNYYLMLIAFNVFRMITLFVTAALFWKCGPRIETFFAPLAGDQQTANVP